MPDNYSLGLIGHPLGHSISPALHQAALAEAGFQGSYSLFPVQPLPDGQSELEALVDRLRKSELQGLNVTIPHKQSVLPVVDELTASAQAIGAVNTLMVKEGRLIGHNTDAPGFLVDVHKLPLKSHSTALILGAGGAARAVAYALLNEGWQVRITDLLPQQAVNLKNHFSQQSFDASQLDVIDFNHKAIIDAGNESALIVNTTPVGMHPHVDQSPWPENTPLPKEACIYDVVYNPMQTRLLQTASAAGLPACNGLGMLVEQAALSFECWTGFSPDRAKMLENVFRLHPEMTRGAV